MTEHKYIWSKIVRRDVLPQFVPNYCKALDALSARQTEVLARHLLRMQRFDMRPAAIRHLHQPRSITWVSIINGTWLLAASADATTSLLSLWPIKAVLSSAEQPPQAVTSVYLKGNVDCGKVYAQGKDVYIALDIRTPYVVQTCTMARVLTHT